MSSPFRTGTCAALVAGLLVMTGPVACSHDWDALRPAGDGSNGGGGATNSGGTGGDPGTGGSGGSLPDEKLCEAICAEYQACIGTVESACASSCKMNFMSDCSDDEKDVYAECLQSVLDPCPSDAEEGWNDCVGTRPLLGGVPAELLEPEVLEPRRLHVDALL